MAQLNTQILLRNDSTENWNINKEKVLGKGEMGIEFCVGGTKKMKIGDGVTTWENLDYAGVDDAQIEALKNAVAAAKSAADSKVASVTAGDNSVTVSGTGTAPTVAVKVDPAEGNALKLGADGLKVEIGATPEYTIEKETTATEGYFASYTLKKDGAQVGVKIDIPKDYLVKSASIKESTGEEDPSGLPTGTKYIDFVVNAKDAGGAESHIYLNVNELVDAYTAGNGITITSENQISVKVVAENGLSVDAAGIKISMASGTAAGAMSSAHYTKLEGIEAGAQVNKLENVSINGETLAISSKKVDIPMATAQKLGVVKGSTLENRMKINGDGTIEVNTINVNKLVQSEGEVLIINGGTSV